MARKPGSRELPAGQAAVLEQLMAATSGMTLGEMEELLQRLLAARSPLADLFQPEPPPSRRRPRRGEVATYQVRVDLQRTKPPLWRRLELDSDLFLDQVHEVIQVAFGWTGGHLHQFSSGPARYGRETERYLCPFDVEEGEAGVPEEDVRLDEVLVAPGDKLYYDYDYGDDWQHLLKLEAVLPRADAAPKAACVAGRRDGPPEDCGGVDAYELISAATDPRHPEHFEAVAEFGRCYGDSVDPACMRLTPFDPGQINGALTRLFPPGAPGAARGDAGQERDFPERLNELIREVQTTAGKRELRHLLSQARVDQPVLVDAGTTARMVRPYTWLLNRVGDDGIKLTSAGYLPPAHVEAAVADLGVGEEWIGAGNRESQIAPVLYLRESATSLGLLRKYRGRLLLTTRARALRTDPAALWWHLAERMPPRSPDPCENQAGLILLAALAAQATEDPDAITARLLGAIGWSHADGTELTGRTAANAAWGTWSVLRRLGALADDGSAHPKPTAGGVTFARAALRSWPAS